SVVLGQRLLQQVVEGRHELAAREVVGGLEDDDGLFGGSFEHHCSSERTTSWSLWITSRPPLVPMMPDSRPESKATRPLATSSPSGPTTSTASPALNVPSTARTPAASRLLLPWETARR